MPDKTKKDKLVAIHIAKFLAHRRFQQCEIIEDGKRIQVDEKSWREEDRVDSFLLWPPDLFAYTSAILLASGAYNFVVCPPVWLKNPNAIELPFKISTLKRRLLSQRLAAWPPEIDLNSALDSITSYDQIKWIAHEDVSSKLHPWNDFVRKNAFEWRLRLENCKPTNAPSVPGLTNNVLHNHKEIMYLINSDDPDTSIIPAAVKQLWHLGKKALCNETLPGDHESVGNLQQCIEREVDTHCKLDEIFSMIAILTLHAIADEASAGFGSRAIKFATPKDFVEDLSRLSWTSDYAKTHLEKKTVMEVLLCDPNNHPIQLWVCDRLKDYGTLSSFYPRRGRVLPKRHSANVGLTIRSLSSHLAYHTSSVKVNWDSSSARQPKRQPHSRTKLSALIIPWPLDPSISKFSPYSESSQYTGLRKEFPKDESLSSRNFNLFKYEASKLSNKDVWEKLRGIIETAVDKLTVPPDIVILPECALSLSQYEHFINQIAHTYPELSVISGVSTPPTASSLGANTVRLHTKSVDLVQYKHHRWKLDRDQTIKYGLGAVLDPFKDWWEAIGVPPRELSFASIGDELTVCPLICEDLSRQDPIGELVRSVGPNLIVAVLLDGPQLKQRWSAKYASVLAEDPGSSVLTLTSLGMVKMHSPDYAPVSSNVVALWTEAGSRSREITLSSDGVAAILSLNLHPSFEGTSDGRRELLPTSRVTLGGVIELTRGEVKGKYGGF